MADVDVHYEPITIQSDPVTVDVKGLDNSHTTITLETPQPVKAETKLELVIPQPLKTEVKTDLAITQPIKTESTTALDIQPVAVDQCLNIRLGPLPPTCIRQPYQLHLGLTLFGVEIVGLSLAGESQLVIPDVPQRPQIAWGGESAAPREDTAQSVQPEIGGGLRIRLGKEGGAR